eukprot:m.116547 g.116547  ORF g.116547 m.116547 type:complete len:292 (+) comp16380_c0_seq1:960-1835(+)
MVPNCVHLGSGCTLERGDASLIRITKPSTMGRHRKKPQASSAARHHPTSSLAAPNREATRSNVLNIDSINPSAPAKMTAAPVLLSNFAQAPRHADEFQRVAEASHSAGGSATWTQAEVVCTTTLQAFGAQTLTLVAMPLSLASPTNPRVADPPTGPTAEANGLWESHVSTTVQTVPIPSVKQRGSEPATSSRPVLRDMSNTSNNDNGNSLADPARWHCPDVPEDEDPNEGFEQLSPEEVIRAKAAGSREVQLRARQVNDRSVFGWLASHQVNDGSLLGWFASHASAIVRCK